MNVIILGAAAQFLQVAIEALKFPKKTDIVAILVQQSHRIMWIRCCHQAISCIPDGFEVSWGNITGYAGECKIEALSRHLNSLLLG